MTTMLIENCRQELVRVARSARVSASARAVLLTTRDREEAIALVESVAAQEKLLLRHITPAALRTYDAATLSWSAADGGDRSPADMIELAHEAGEACIVMFEELLGQIRDGSQHVKARLRLAELLAQQNRPAGTIIVLVEAPDAEAHIPSMTAAQVVKLAIGYPRTGDLETLAKAEIATFSHRSGASVELSAIRQSAPELASGLVGLTRKAARDVLHDALAMNPADLSGAARHLVMEKARRLSRELSMEVLDTSTAEVPAGVEYLLQYLEIQKPRMRIRGRDRARGVLLVGPPGTGKTMLARAVGHLSGLPVVIFRIGSLMNSLVGETERLFGRAFATLEAMAPCVVFIDEIDKAFGESSELDGGTMARVTGSLLSWLSDNPNPNYVIGTCNNVSRMGDSGRAMFRSERFDACYFVDVPGASARREILQRGLRSFMDETQAASLACDLAERTAKFSGADIFSGMKLATAVAEHAKRPVNAEDFQLEMEKKCKRVEALYEEFSKLRSWAESHCEAAGEYDPRSI